MTDILLTRHGMTNENLNYTLIGHTDPPLNKCGMKQAEALAEALAQKEFAAIFSSPLLRAKQTSERITCKCKKIPLIVDQNLREIHLGIMEGLSSFTAYDRYKELIDEALDPNKEDFTFPRGEWRSDALHRFEKSLSEMVQRYPSDTICVVTHGGLIGLWLAKLHKIPLGSFRKWQPGHASITKVQVTGGDYKILSFDNKDHLNQFHNASY